MATVTKQKARKEWTCGCCRKTIAVGDEYISFKPRYRTPIIRCMGHNCRIHPSEMTGSDKMQRLLEIGEQLEDMIGPGSDELISAAEDAINTIEEVAGEYSEGADNIEQYFTSGTDTSEEMRSNADELQSWQSSIEEKRDTLQSAIDDEPEFDEENEPELDDFETEDAFAEAHGEWEKQKTDHKNWESDLDSATSEMQEALGEMPI